MDAQPIDDASELATQLHGVRFTWRNGGRPDIGVIAEEVAAVIPEVVSFEEDGVTAKAVDYGRLVAVLIEAAKEQRATIHALQARVARLEAQRQPQQ